MVDFSMDGIGALNPPPSNLPTQGGIGGPPANPFVLNGDPSASASSFPGGNPAITDPASKAQYAHGAYEVNPRQAVSPYDGPGGGSLSNLLKMVPGLARYAGPLGAFLATMAPSPTNQGEDAAISRLYGGHPPQTNQQLSAGFVPPPSGPMNQFAEAAGGTSSSSPYGGQFPKENPSIYGPMLGLTTPSSHANEMAQPQDQSAIPFPKKKPTPPAQVPFPQKKPPVPNQRQSLDDMERLTTKMLNQREMARLNNVPPAQVGNSPNTGTGGLYEKGGRINQKSKGALADHKKSDQHQKHGALKRH